MTEVIPLEDGTYWKLYKRWKAWGKWTVEIWVRYTKSGYPLEARKVIETSKSISSIVIPVPKKLRKR